LVGVGLRDAFGVAGIRGVADAARVGFTGTGVEGCICIYGKKVARTFDESLFGFAECWEDVSEGGLEGLGVVAISPRTAEPPKDKVVPIRGEVGQSFKLTSRAM
jgi:hypothetical protein